MNTILALALFIPSLQQEYFFTDRTRALALDNEVKVQALGPVTGWTNPDAVATYNPILNVISLNKALMNGDKVKTAKEIMGPLGDYSKISTIFHEMGHAEMDVFIENEKTDRDILIMNHYNTKLQAFYKKHFPGFNTKTIFHEHFGYYRAELIEYLSNEMNNLLMINGYNKFKKTCFLTGPLRVMLHEGTTLEEFTKMQVFDEGDFFRKSIGPRFIFVRGKDIDLSSAPQEMIKETHDLFWAYHQDFYNFPMNRKEMVKRMNDRSEHRDEIIACRTKIFNEYPQE